MTLRPLGPDGAQQRMQELDARVRAKFGVRPSPIAANPARQIQAAFNATLQGEIGGLRASVAPMRPGGLHLPGAENLREMIHEAATQEGVDGHLLEALISVESDFNPGAVSSAGAMGLAQLMPGTAKALGVSDPFDPIQNARGGAKYLRQMLDQFGDLRTALAAYNAGPGNVQKYGGIPPFRETQNYIRRVTERYDLLARGGSLGR